jgi:hypothetical protein
MRRTAAVLSLSLALVLTAADPRPPEAKLVPAKPGEPAAVEVTGIEKPTLTALRDAKLTPAEWAEFCRVVVDGGTPEEVAARPPVAGTWSATADAVRFEPQFPLAPGVTYRVTCRLHDVPRLKPRPGGFSVTLSVPKPPPGPRVSVAAVYPSADRLPENTLRLYVQFSGRMSQGDIYRHVKLVRDGGKEVSHPFLEIDEELWSADGTRITLLFHPGRVKRGLKPREEEGPILEEGRRYTLTIGKDWEDAEGRPLTAGFTKTFSAGPPDDEPVNPDSWALIPPRGGDTPLIVRLAKPLDRALLGRLLWVTDAAGQRIDGTVSVGGGERVVTFAPAQPWRRGDYKLVVDTRLEDVCGNRVGEPFEVDVFKPVQRKIETKTAERPFAVR